MAQDDSYADPQDLQFGKAAAEKEDRLDEKLDRGEDPRGSDAPESEKPRAGNKADPS